MNSHFAMTTRIRRGGWMIGPMLVSVMLALLGAGCSTEDPQVQAMRGRLLLEEAPDHAMTITEAKSAVTENANVAVIARIAPDLHEAFVPGQAAFLVTEILPEEDGHGGKQHADNCPFCKRKAAEAPRAAVQFVDESGSPLKADARELFGIRCGDEVVIRGKGELLGELNIFQVTADGIYLRNRRAE
ncbi:MAG: hypothetical protein H8E66_25975 [Planctomycetes bacterium]|nr:hypothetical protein [Planctomycetota bacterium]